jgi:CRP/FNR family transcriptional regulator, anaerobic regulatory protein
MVSTDLIERNYPFFEKELIEKIAEVGEVKSFQSGEILMKTGQNIRSTLLIVSGLVKIYRENEEGNEFFMYYLEPGNACALSIICAVRHEKSEVMAKAVADTDAIVIPLNYMDEWMNKYKSWAHFVLQSYRGRFEELLQTIDHIAFRNMDERLVFYLKRHQKTSKTNMISVTHTEIAQELTSSREVITRLLKKLADKGMIRLHRHSIEIIDLEMS